MSLVAKTKTQRCTQKTNWANKLLSELNKCGSDYIQFEKAMQTLFPYFPLFPFPTCAIIKNLLIAFDLPSFATCD